jgi:hypothetical protein
MALLERCAPRVRQVACNTPERFAGKVVLILDLDDERASELGMHIGVDKAPGFPVDGHGIVVLAVSAAALARTLAPIIPDADAIATPPPPRMVTVVVVSHGGSAAAWLPIDGFPLTRGVA